MKELGREGRDLQDVSTFSDQGWNASATTLRSRNANVTTSMLTAIARDNKKGNPWREGGRNVVTMREETFMEADRKMVTQAAQQIIAGGTRGYRLHLGWKTGDFILMQEGTVLAVIEFYGSFVTAIKTLKRFLNAFERSHQGEIIKRTQAAPWSFNLVEIEAQELQKLEGGTMNTNSRRRRRSPAKDKGNGKGKSKDKTDMNEKGGKGKFGKGMSGKNGGKGNNKIKGDLHTARHPRVHEQRHECQRGPRLRPHRRRHGGLRIRPHRRRQRGLRARPHRRRHCGPRRRPHRRQRCGLELRRHRRRLCGLSRHPHRLW